MTPSPLPSQPPPAASCRAFPFPSLRRKEERVEPAGGGGETAERTGRARKERALLPDGAGVGCARTEAAPIWKG